ncbi:MAG: acyltransferase [Desulfobacterium sp.]
MIKTLKLLKYQFQDRYGRLLLAHWITRELPGVFGERIRRKMLGRYFKRCGENLIIHQGFRFRGIHHIIVGDNVQIGVDSFIQASGGLEMGDDVMLGPGVKIWTVNHRFENPHIPIYDQGYERKPVKIEKGVWLGANVFVLPGVTISEGCVVTAGSLVGIKRYPPYAILSGNPCRVIGTRRLNHILSENDSHSMPSVYHNEREKGDDSLKTTGAEQNET